MKLWGRFERLRSKAEAWGHSSEEVCPRTLAWDIPLQEVCPRTLAWDIPLQEVCPRTLESRKTMEPSPASLYNRLSLKA